MRRMFGFLIGIMVGTLVGATVALLLAPETGDALRNEIRARGENFVGDVRHAAEARRTEMAARLDSLREPHT